MLTQLYICINIKDDHEMLKKLNEATKLRISYELYIYISFVNKRVIKDKLKVKNQISKYTISDNG